MLPPLLTQLSDEGKRHPGRQARPVPGHRRLRARDLEELAALGGDIASVHERHSRLLHGNMRLRSDGWGMVNAAGCSEVELGRCTSATTTSS